MREVSCRMLESFFRALRKKKLPPETLTRGLDYPLRHLQNKNERIDWDQFRLFMANCRDIWTDEEFERLGGAWIDSPVFKYVKFVAGLLFTPKQLYRWLTSEGKDKSLGTQMFTCITSRYVDAGPDRAILDVTVDEGYDPCREFFVLSKGGFAQIPRILGLPPAKLEVTWTARGAQYDIAIPRQTGVHGIVHRFFAWIFSPRTVAKELTEAHEVLSARYRELETAKSVLALQATRLRTAHEIGELVHGEIELASTLSTVTRTLVNIGGFAAAELQFHESSIVGNSEGVQPPEIVAIETPLPVRSGPIGVVRAWPAPGCDGDERRELLEFVAPTIAMAIDNAIAYRELADYQQNLERKVEERTAELTRARDDLAQNMRRLAEAKQSRDRIFANINHEIRTPITLVLMTVKTLRANLGAEREDEVAELDRIEGNARRLLRLVDELLLLAAGQEHKLSVNAAPCDLAEVLRKIVDLWTPAASAHGLQLGCSAPDRCRVGVDQVLMERVINNLLSNAIKFTPSGGSIQASLERHGDQILLEVRDTGVGIDADLKKRLFGRFEQGRPALPSRGTGSGIGLSLVREIVQAHGGTVEAVSARGGGTSFLVRMPAGALETHPLNGAQATRLRGDATPGDFGLGAQAPLKTDVGPAETARAVVLIAEDNHELAAEMVRLLSKEHRVLVASDGLSALQLCDKHKPDMLVSDVGMPGMDGLELSRRFRALPGNRLAPVLLVSAFANIAERLAGFEAGAVDYITKPFEPAELIARVRSQLALRELALKLHQSEKLVALGTMSSGLAHELRNPANAIVNAVGPLCEKLPPELLEEGSPVAELISVLRDSASHISDVSKQLLGFRREGTLARKEESMGVIYGKALSMMKPALRLVELREHMDYKGPVYCAAPLLTQVLTNLLENAAQAAGPRGWVEVRSRQENGKMVFEVADSGPGVPPELRERIFEPFFTTKPAGQGTGLGLTTARDIALRHDGVLEVLAAQAGSVFHLEIPIAPEKKQ